MKVVIDVRQLHPNNWQRGVGFYCRRLLENLQSLENDDFSVELLEKGELSADIDLIHYPWFDLFSSTLPLKKKLPTLVTIHDLIPLHFANHFPSGIKGQFHFQKQKLALKMVSLVITDSFASQKDIVNFLKIPENKIAVIYLAADALFRPMTNYALFQSVLARYRLPQRFILYVGDINWNKNIPGLIKAFYQIKNQNSEVKLVFVGKAFLDSNLPEAQQINALIKDLHLENDVLKLGFVPTEDLVVIYSLATVYCQPSFWEGFGLPVLEAMSCGVPVIVGNRGSLTEIVAETGLLVDPESINSMAAGLQKALKSPDNDLVQKNLQRAQTFNWSKTAQATLKAYQQVFHHE